MASGYILFAFEVVQWYIYFALNDASLLLASFDMMVFQYDVDTVLNEHSVEGCNECLQNKYFTANKQFFFLFPLVNFTLPVALVFAMLHCLEIVVPHEHECIHWKKTLVCAHDSRAMPTSLTVSMFIKCCSCRAGTVNFTNVHLKNLLEGHC